MNTAKMHEMKAKLDAAFAAHEEEKERLIALGLKSKERYEALKPLKAIVDSLNAEYVSFSHKQIKGELNKIIKSEKAAMNRKITDIPGYQA